MTNEYTECALILRGKTDTLYEALENKKTTLSGDYSEDEDSYPTCGAVNDKLANKISKSNTAGLVKNDGTIDTTQYLSSLPSHSHEATEVTDDNSANYTNMGTLSADATQQSINNAINTQLGSLLNIDLIVVVASLPTASADTMNKMYLVAETTPATQDTYEVYITVRTGTSPNYSYDWEKVDTARIDLTNYIEKSLTTGLIKNDGTVDTTNYEDTNNKVTSISSSSTDTEYPSAKLLYDTTRDGTFTELQTLITNASSGDIINLDKDYKNTGNDPITFTNKTLTINANGHIIDGNNNSQVLYLSTDANITINNAIIKNGYSNQYNGGAITLPSSTNSQLTLNNCTIIDNTLNGTGYSGAGAYVGANSTLIVNNCIFNNNTSNSNGGAIFGGSNSTVYINNSTFTNNTANSGGAIQNATCINTVFNNNTATANTGAGAIRDGTAINCTFQGNTAPQRTASGAMRNGTATNCRFITTTDTTDSTTVKDYVTT